MAYSDVVLAMESSDLITYWPLGEASGTTADNLEGTAQRDADYNSDVSTWPVETGIGDGNTAPSFDGTNDLINCYSVSLRNAFDGEEGTILIWLKPDSGMWTDGNEHIMVYWMADADNRIFFRKNTANGQAYFWYEANNTTKTVTVSSQSWEVWTPVAITWSKTADEFKVYIDGSQVGSTQTGLGAWEAVNLSATLTTIGSYSTSATVPWKGGGAHAACWTKALSGAQILSLASLPAAGNPYYAYAQQ